PGIQTPSGFFVASISWSVVFLLLWATGVTVLKAVGYGPTIGSAKRGTWALKVVMLCHHTFISSAAVLAILEDPALMATLRCGGFCLEPAQRLLRDTVRSASAEALVPVTLGFMIADLALMSQWSLCGGKKGVGDFLMFLHHIGALIGWPPAVVPDLCTRYILVLLAFEISSVFLTINWFLSTAGLKSSRAYIVTGLIFTASFVLVRLLAAVPLVVALFTANPLGFTGETGLPHPHIFLILANIGLLFPHGLNFIWGYKVIQGCAAVVFASKASEAKKNSD
ncbi:unnamed protein product, partial [Polarella glacialis]